MMYILCFTMNLWPIPPKPGEDTVVFIILVLCLVAIGNMWFYREMKILNIFIIFGTDTYG